MAQTHFILRHFEDTDLDNIESISVDYGTYDGFVYGHTGIQEDVVANLIASGKRCFRYYDVMDFGEAGWSDAWFDFWQGTVQPVAGLVNGTAEPAVFRLSPSCVDRQFVDWSLIDATLRQTIANKMFELAPNSGLFLDQAWLAEAPYFFFSEPTTVGGCGPCAYCAAYSEINPAKWPLYQASILAFYQLVDTMAAVGGHWVLKNGEHRTIGSPAQAVPRPIYYENAAANNLEDVPRFDNAVIGWKENTRNVLSLILPDAVNQAELLDEFGNNGGWIAFTGPAASSSAVQAAYAAAAEIRAASLGGGGAVMPNPALCTESLNENYTLGTGRLYLQRAGGTEQEVGNIVVAEVSFPVETVEHRRGRDNALDAVLALSRDYIINFTTDELTANTLSILLNETPVSTVDGCKIPFTATRCVPTFGARLVHPFPCGTKIFEMTIWRAAVLSEFSIPFNRDGFTEMAGVIRALACDSNHPNEPFGQIIIYDSECPAS